MKNCIRCNHQIEMAVAFCQSCGQNQQQKIINRLTNRAVLLNTLCILTIIGSIFTMGRGIFYEMISSLESSSNYMRGWIYVISAIGTMIGAIMMMDRKLKGLYIYTISQIVYCLTVVAAFYVRLEDSMKDAQDNASLFANIAALFLIPSILFLLLYWTKTVKKHLK